MSYELSEEALYNNDEFFDAEFFSYDSCKILNAAVILLLCSVLCSVSG
jgi:hypothetical protein